MMKFVCVGKLNVLEKVEYFVFREEKAGLVLNAEDLERNRAHEKNALGCIKFILRLLVR